MKSNKKYFFVGAGGFFGGVIRFLMKDIKIESFPWTTLLINITGTFTFAFLIINLLIRKRKKIKLLICYGFLGAYTTFSTFCKEAYKMILIKNYFGVVSYILLSAAFGFISAYIGNKLGNKNAIVLKNG